MSIYPVVIMVPSCVCDLDRKNRYYYTGLIARKSAFISSEMSGLSLKKMCKDRFGAPLQCGDVYWSITHKSKYTAGVTANTPVGIDIEELISRSYSLLRNRIANPHEWSLGKGDPEMLFLRYFTAKEAVLKAERKGLMGLSRCFVRQVVDKTSMIVSYGLNKWNVTHFYFGYHIAAVATKINGIGRIKWILLEK